MRKLYVNIVLINFVFLIISYFLLPDRVACHLGIGGMPNAYTSKVNYLLIFIALELPMAFFYYYLPYLIINIPKNLVGMPNAEYWLKDEKRQETRKVVEPLIYQCGSALFVFLLFCSGISLSANLGSPIKLKEDAMFIGLGLFITYIIYWCVKFYRVFRIKQ